MKIVTIDFANSVIENFDSGVQGEHNATQIAIIPPADMPLTLSYRLAFEPGGLTETLLLTDGKILYENGEFKTVDAEKILAESRVALKELYV